MFCKKCGTELAADAAFCEKCGTPVSSTIPPAAESPVSEPSVPAQDAANQPLTGQDATEQPTAEQPVQSADAPETSSPAAPEKKKSKKGLIIGIIIAVIAVICIGCFALGGSADSPDPIIGKWTMIAYADQDNDNEIIPLSSSTGFYVEFREDHTVTLYLTEESKGEGTWETYPELSEKNDGNPAYKLNLDGLPQTVASMSEVDGKTTVFILMTGMSYGMIFQ